MRRALDPKDLCQKNKKGEGEGVRPRSQIPETQAKPNELKEFLAEHIETHIQSQAATVTEITFRAGVQWKKIVVTKSKSMNKSL